MILFQTVFPILPAFAQDPNVGILDPNGWHDLNLPAEPEATPVNPASLAPVVQNAAEQPGLGEIHASSMMTEVRECYWLARFEDVLPTNSQGFVLNGDSYSGSNSAQATSNGQTSASMTIEQEWTVADAAEVYVTARYKGKLASPNMTPNLTVIMGTDFYTTTYWSGSSFSDTEWRLFEKRIDTTDTSILTASNLKVSLSLATPAVTDAKFDLVGLIACKKPIDIDTAVPTIEPVKDPKEQIRLLLSGLIYFHGGPVSNLLNDVGLVGKKYMIENGLHHMLYGTKYWPGANPHALGEVKELDGMGAYLTRDCAYACKYAQQYGITRGYSEEVGREMIAKLEDQLTRITSPEKRQLKELLLSWNRLRLDYWLKVIKPNPTWVDMVNRGVVYGVEAMDDELDGPFLQGLEWFAKNPVAWSRLRLLIFPEGTPNNVIFEAYRQALRNGASPSALVVVRGNLGEVAEDWETYVKANGANMWRSMPSVWAYGVGYEALTWITGTSAKLYALAETTGGIVIPAAGGAIFIVGAADTIKKTYDFANLETWETGLTWSEYVRINSGFTRIMMSHDVLEYFEGYLETDITQDEFRPMRFKIPEHWVTGHSYVDGRRLFLKVPESESVMMWRVKEVVEKNSADFGHVVLQKQTNDGSVVEVPISFKTGQTTYSMVYDEPKLGLITMHFEFSYIKHSDDGHFTIGVNFFTTETPEQYGACVGWSNSRPVDKPCYTGITSDRYEDYPDMDNDGLRTFYENPDPNGDGNPADGLNTDGDAYPDYIDLDDDADGFPTILERADPNGDGDPSDAVDTDHDGVPDYLDKDSHPVLNNLYLPFTLRALVRIRSFLWCSL
ncbi:hypothetical protein BH09PAT2_BH09PAT2_07500 [soil metagenome]